MGNGSDTRIACKAKVTFTGINFQDNEISSGSKRYPFINSSDNIAFYNCSFDWGRDTQRYYVNADSVATVVIDSCVFNSVKNNYSGGFILGTDLMMVSDIIVRNSIWNSRDEVSPMVFSAYGNVLIANCDFNSGIEFTCVGDTKSIIQNCNFRTVNSKVIIHSSNSGDHDYIELYNCNFDIRCNHYLVNSYNLDIHGSIINCKFGNNLNDIENLK